MALQNFTGLDFDQIKTTLIDYIRSNSNFTDYDFEGSNLSTIIDLLAYNTYITSYNANMVSNEVFLDSATLRENVVSLARNIGYVPRSKKASKTNINFSVDTTLISPKPTSLLLNKGVVAVSQNQFANQSFTFIIPEDVTVPVIDNTARFDNIEIFEGTLLKQSFTVNYRNLKQRFILPNTGIDIDTLRVKVRPSESSSVATTYYKKDNLFDNNLNSVLNEESTIFFLQEVEGEQYELIFGDGVFGKKLEDGSIIDVTYAVTSGESANGVSNLDFSGKLSYVRNSIDYTVVSGISFLTLDNVTTGGESIESVDSIRKYAPQIYSTQNRALTASDYETLIPRKIYTEAESVSVFGGEDLVPPQYGKVFISIKPRTGDFVPNSIKQNIKNQLRSYAVAGIVPEILDLKYLFLETDSKIYYNPNLVESSSFLSSLIQSNINKYGESAELNRYGARFKYSKFLGIIDQSHEAVSSNITSVKMRRDLGLAINSFAEYTIDFGNEFHIQSMNGFNIKSSAFRVLNISDDVYLYDVPSTNRTTGTISLYSGEFTDPVIRRRNVGTIDYMKGRITLRPINIVSGKSKNDQQIMEITACPHSNDVIGLQDLFIQLDRVDVEMIADPISSGNDPSGSTFTSSSSYVNVNNNPY